MSNQVIPIFYACDDNFVKYTIVSLRSMMENASKGNQYKVYILNTDISGRMKKIMYDMAGGDFEVRFVDVSHMIESIKDRLPIRDYYSKTTYFRLFIAEMFPEYQKAVYIDSDTVVLGDIAEFYNHELGDCWLGGAHEQAMVQIDEYGTYVEECVGVERDNYFNAGVILINCEQFRRQRVLEQFIQHLHEYDFVVTQDEDYLNLICHNHVLWLDSKWNMEVFGEIPVAEPEFKILHFIMVSKPWHFSDCRYREYFWKYAEMTDVYEEIAAVLDAYTDEERAEDLASCDRLLQTAVDETNRDDNYLKMVRSGKLSRDNESGE